MKNLILLNLLLVCFSVTSLASDPSENESSVGTTLYCDLADTVYPNSGSIRSSDSKEKIVFCHNYHQVYTVTFYGFTFPYLTPGISHHGKFRINCSLSVPHGAYLFGGLPVRTTADTYRHEPWFYTHDDNRCVLSGNEKLLKKISGTPGRSVMAIY